PRSALIDSRATQQSRARIRRDADRQDIRRDFGGRSDAVAQPHSSLTGERTDAAWLATEEGGRVCRSSSVDSGTTAIGGSSADGCEPTIARWTRAFDTLDWLIKEFGEGYRLYQRRVRMLVPFFS